MRNPGAWQMNSIHSTLSRRGFILSTAAAAVSSAFHQTEGPLHVSIVGFGRHAQRFLDGVAGSFIHVDAVFDPDPVALRSASALLKHRQLFLPELVRAARPTLIAQSVSPVLLCSPPNTWAALIPHLTAHGRPVLAHHTQLFAAPSWPESLQLLSRQPANLLLVGIDPAFPLHSLRSFHAFARCRGALDASYSLRHAAWPQAQLLAFQFDSLNAALPQDVSYEEHRKHWQFLPMPIHHDFRTPASARPGSGSCSISAAGPGIAFGAHIEITDGTSGVSSSPEYLLRFAEFCRLPQSARDRMLLRQFALLKLVHASTEAMTLFA
jgi:hypothetical protein